jgi:outer membrane receptor protein involved in Fe transport
MSPAHQLRLFTLIAVSLGQALHLIHPCAAADIRGTVTTVTPMVPDPAAARVLLQRAGAESQDPASPGSTLASGDALFTRQSGLAQVLLARNGHILTLRELSSLRFVETERGTWFRLLRGALHFLSGRGHLYSEFEADYVIGGSLGTEYELRIEGASTVISVFHGEVTFTNTATLPDGTATNFIRSISANQQAVIRGDRPPEIRPLLAAAEVQWWLYYPAVIDPAELPLSEDERHQLRASLEAYRQGDLPGALLTQPHPAGSPGAVVYQAALRIAAGATDHASALLAQTSHLSPDDPARSLAAALNLMVATVTGRRPRPPLTPTTASEFVALSYERQAQLDLPGALDAARHALRINPRFGIAALREAELLVNLGRHRNARAALERARALVPLHPQWHVLSGFLLASEDRLDAAHAAFDEAIRLNPRLANGYLGRGLIRIRRGGAAGLDAGIEDLRLAAAREPNRALLRAYLAKALQIHGEFNFSNEALRRAMELDPADPTAWLYLALLRREQNRINEGILALRQSIQRNDNRHVFRSRLLLDEDRAVRGANLASLYRDAGMEEVARREAARAVDAQYANPSAHLFLAHSYNLLRDQRQADLRYETAWFSEFLLGNLLAPVSVSALSQTLSENEYGRLFERRHPLGVASTTEYLSRGAWWEAGSVHGVVDRVAYALEAFYLNDPGEGLNDSVESVTLWPKIKVQLTPDDSLYLQGILYDYDAGDVTRYRDPASANPALRVSEDQDPLLFLGHHHRWHPGSHTLLLAGVFRDQLTLDDPRYRVPLFSTDAAGRIDLVPYPPDPSEDRGRQGLLYESRLEGYSVGLQQILELTDAGRGLNDHTLVVGGRYQQGTFDGTARIGRGQSPVRLTNGSLLWLETPPIQQDASSAMERLSLYAYDFWNPASLPWLSLSAGIGFDHLRYPLNHRVAPLSEAAASTDQVSPRAGVILRPDPRTILRAAYSRALGGVSFDQSFRLEPTQIAGFNQAFRSLIPESVAGPTAAPEFDLVNAAVERVINENLLLSLSGGWALSTLDRLQGAFERPVTSIDPIPSGLADQLEYREWNLQADLHWLVDEHVTVSAIYRLVDATLDSSVPAAADAVQPFLNTRQNALLHEAALRLSYNAWRDGGSGWFANAEGLIVSQHGHDEAGTRFSDDFFQVNLSGGYRFSRRRVELRAGILNLTDADYRLHPLNLHPRYPRSRTLALRLSFSY